MGSYPYESPILFPSKNKVIATFFPCEETYPRYGVIIMLLKLYRASKAISKK